MSRLFGIETEYGITVEGKGAGDLVNESIQLVRSFAGKFVTGWNYRGEDARRDMRGFVVDRLSMNPDDAQFDSPGKAPMSMAEERSDRILSNGARLYNDHGHPEYSTPECSTLLELVSHDKAGELILMDCSLARSNSSGLDVRLYKNNTDFHGASYGTHECFLMRRDVPTDVLISSLIPFLVTRQLFAGAGKVGVEVDRASGPTFQLSQRADYFSVEASVDTLHNRPIVNTRDEPHATPRLYRRLHVIIGDANMSEWATAIKIGTTSLVVGLLEDGWRPKLRLKSPIAALKAISRDQSLDWTVMLDDGSLFAALDVQRYYLNEARRRFAGRDADTDWTLMEWELVLNQLGEDYLKTADRVDWAAKRRLLEQFMVAEGLRWDDPMMQSLDLAYHDIDPQAGLYAGLEQAGEMRKLVSQARIESSVSCAPSDTRAALRGHFVRRYPAAVRSIGWNGVAFKYKNEDLLFDMNPLVEPNVAALVEEFDAANSLDELVAVIQRKPEHN